MFQKNLPIAVINADLKLKSGEDKIIPIKDFNLFDLNILKNYKNYAIIQIRGIIRESSPAYNFMLSLYVVYHDDTNIIYSFGGIYITPSNSMGSIRLNITITDNTVIFHVE